MKSMYSVLFLAVGLMACVLTSPALAQDEDVLEELIEIAVIDQKILVPMRDGVRLATDVYRPKGRVVCPSSFRGRHITSTPGGMANSERAPTNLH